MAFITWAQWYLNVWFSVGFNAFAQHDVAVLCEQVCIYLSLCMLLLTLAQVERVIHDTNCNSLFKFNFKSVFSTFVTRYLDVGLGLSAMLAACSMDGNVSLLVKYLNYWMDLCGHSLWAEDESHWLWWSPDLCHHHQIKSKIFPVLWFKWFLSKYLKN